MADGELESSRETVRGVSEAVPPMPVVKSAEIWHDSLFTLVEGWRYGLGWRGWPQEAGGPGFVTVRRSAAGFLKIVKRYPLTEEGWAQAWRALAGLDRDAARRALEVLARRAGPSGQASANPLVVDYGLFHADPAVIRDGRASIPVDAVSGWTANLTVHPGGAPTALAARDFTHLFFRVTGPGNSIELNLSATGSIARDRHRAGHANLDQLSGRLQDYGTKVINPVLVPRLCQQVISGQLKVGLLTITQAGLSRPGAFGARMLTWPEYFSSETVNGRVRLYRRKQPGRSTRKRRPWYKVSLSETNAIVLPLVLTELDRYFNPK
jgi:hypothetical protein